MSSSAGSDDEALLHHAVRAAGTVVMQYFNADLKHWEKRPNDPVSEADLAADRLLHEHLIGARPDYGWLSEETADTPERLDRRQVWIIDPIDGTRAYIGGLPDWSIATALVEDGRPIVAALYAPVDDEMFVAVAGKGATLNGQPIRVGDGGLDGTRIAAPPGYLRRLQQNAPGIAPQPKIHSLALRFARVAHGAIEAAFASGNSHDWDLAGADLLVHEAGGLLTTFTGQSLTYNRPDPVHPPLVAAGPQRHAALIALVQEHPISR